MTGEEVKNLIAHEIKLIESSASAANDYMRGYTTGRLDALRYISGVITKCEQEDQA